MAMYTIQCSACKHFIEIVQYELENYILMTAVIIVHVGPIIVSLYKCICRPNEGM